MEISPAAPLHASAPNAVAYTPTAVGTYRLTCHTDVPGVTTPPPQTVTVVAAAPAVLQAVLAQSRTKAGAVVGASCVARDAFGNTVDVPAATWLVQSPLTHGPTGLTATRAGTYNVSCSVPAWPHLSASPSVPLSVVAAAPASVQTWLAKAQVPAHAPITVRCEAHDAYANPVAQADTAFRVTGGPVALTPDGFTADRAG
ncbi:MAG: hypothetical protein EOO40_05315, partial [Deltaproteobacteria bacterium]